MLQERYGGKIRESPYHNTNCGYGWTRVTFILCSDLLYSAIRRNAGSVETILVPARNV